MVSSARGSHSIRRSRFACAAGEITTAEPTIDMPRPVASTGSLCARSARSISYCDSTVYRTICFLTSAFALSASSDDAACSSSARRM